MPFLGGNQILGLPGVGDAGQAILLYREATIAHSLQCLHAPFLAVGYHADLNFRPGPPEPDSGANAQETSPAMACPVVLIGLIVLSKSSINSRIPWSAQVSGSRIWLEAGQEKLPWRESESMPMGNLTSTHKYKHGPILLYHSREALSIVYSPVSCHDSGRIFHGPGSAAPHCLDGDAFLRLRPGTQWPPSQASSRQPGATGRPDALVRPQLGIRVSGDNRRPVTHRCRRSPAGSAPLWPPARETLPPGQLPDPWRRLPHPRATWTMANSLLQHIPDVGTFQRYQPGWKQPGTG